MSFERTSKSIENLTGHEEITLDLLFDMMVKVAQDVMEYNKTTDLSNTPIGDQSKLLKKVCNLMELTLSAYTKNKEGMSEFSSSTQEKYSKLADDMDIVLSEVAEVKDLIEKAEVQKKELQKKQADLRKSRGDLLTVGKDCKVLQRQIDVLSDSALDEKAKEKENLAADLSERKASMDELETEISKLRKENEKIIDEVKVINEKFLVMQKEETNLIAEKKRMENSNKELEQQIEEYKVWIENYPVISEKMKSEYDEAKAKITTMINALNSVFLEKNNLNTHVVICDYPNSNPVNVRFESLQELQQWFDALNEQINGQMNVYETMLKNYVSQSEKLMGDSESLRRKNNGKKM